MGVHSVRDRPPRFCRAGHVDEAGDNTPRVLHSVRPEHAENSPYVWRWPPVLCRVTTAALALLGVAQTVVAGSFLSGHYDALRIHLVLAMVMVGVSVAQAVGVVQLHLSGGPRSVLVAGLLLLLLLAGQIALGMARVVGVHTPIGVLVVVVIVQLTAAVWRRRSPARVPAAGRVLR